MEAIEPSLVVAPEQSPLPAIGSLPLLAQYTALTDEARGEFYRAAVRLLQSVKAQIAGIEATHAPGVDYAFMLHRARVAARKEALAEWLDAAVEVKSRLVEYEQHEAQLQREAERQALVAAKEAEERLRLEEAAALEAVGEDAMARQVLETPAPMATIVAPRAVPKLAEAQSRESWSAEIVDMRKLCAAVAAGTVPETVVIANKVILTNAARALKGNLNWPGIRVTRTAGMAVRR